MGNKIIKLDNQIAGLLQQIEKEQAKRSIINKKIAGLWVAVKALRAEKSTLIKAAELPISEARREYAYVLRTRGMTFREIGNRLGIQGARASCLAYAYHRNSL
jgi:hypothetical protein